MGKLATIFSVFCRLALLLPLSGLAAVVWQYEGAGATSNEWFAARHGEPLVALHNASNGWNAAEIRQVGKHRTVGFPETASPFTFPTNTANPVAVVYAVVRNSGALEGMETLVEAPYNVCVRLVPPLFASEALKWQEELLGWRATYRVNGKDTARFEPSPAFQLVEIRFETPPLMRDLYIGNAAASPLWQRHWRGEIGELLFFTREPTQQEQHALYNYLRLKWGIPLAYDTVDAVAILNELGIRRGAVFGTLFIVR